MVFLVSAGRQWQAALNDVVRRALKSTGIPSILERVGIDRGDDKRPDVFSVFPFSNGKCLCWDATYAWILSLRHTLIVLL